MLAEESQNQRARMIRKRSTPRERNPKVNLKAEKKAKKKADRKTLQEVDQEILQKIMKNPLKIQRAKKGFPKQSTRPHIKNISTKHTRLKSTVPLKPNSKE